MTKLGSSLVLYDFIRLPLSFYRLVGFKLFQWDETDVWTVKEMCYMVFVNSCLLLGYSLKVCFPIFDEFESSIHASEWFVYTIVCINLFCKIVSVLFGRKALYAILRDIEKIFPKTQKEREDFRLTECYAYIMHHVKLLAISHFSIAVLFIAMPVVQSTLEYIQSDEENRRFVGRFPYIITYPYDATRGMAYVLSYIGQVVGGSAVSLYFVGTDMLIISTVYLVIMQYDYLCYRIGNFESKGYEMDMQELKQVLQRHNTLNEAAETVNEVFRLSILMNYMISTVVLVLTGVQIILGTETLGLVKFIGLLGAAVVQMYYVCKFGTDLMEASSQVSEALIGHAWYMADVRYQRIIVLAIARSQKPAHLTAYKFFMISMETFSNVMTTSYQMFTLLKAQME